MNYYELLGITPEATLVDIKKAYRRAAFRCHPDRNPPERKVESEKEFKRVSEAYQVLSDPIQRKIYDCCGKTDDFVDFKGASELFKELFPDISADISNETWEIIDNIFDEIDNGKSFIDIARGLPYLKILKTQLPSVINMAKQYFMNFSTNNTTDTREKNGGELMCDNKSKTIKPVVIINEFLLEDLHTCDTVQVKYTFLRYKSDDSSYMKDTVIEINNYLTSKRIYYSDNGHEYERGKFSGLIVYNRVKTHDRFKRKSNYDLYVVEKVNVTDLVMRRMYYFQWLDDSFIEIPLSQTILNLPVICLRGWGLTGVGDLYIHFQINHISTIEYDLLQKIQPFSTEKYTGDAEKLHIDVPIERVRMIFDG